MMHKLKTWPEYFEAVKRGDKTFEIRKNDRNFQIGDKITLIEYNPALDRLTGDWLIVEITYILESQMFVQEGYVCMSIKHIIYD
jgi:ASC-1-like (ASCH) protein